MMEFDSQDSPVTSENTNTLLSKTFFRMFLGLVATAFAAWYTYSSGMIESLIYSNSYFIIFIVEIAIVIIFSAGFKKLSPAIVTGLFFAYSIITGITFSTLFAVFEIESIVYAFVGTAALFGILAYIGKTTKKDLTSFGTMLSITLLVGVVISLINLFIGNTMVDIVLNWIILFVFMGFTIYDMNKITHMQDMGIMENEKLYVYGAMELYLDFINLFLRILYLFGNRKD